MSTEQTEREAGCQHLCRFISLPEPQVPIEHCLNCGASRRIGECSPESFPWEPPGTNPPTALEREARLLAALDAILKYHSSGENSHTRLFQILDAGHIAAAESSAALTEKPCEK